MDFKDALVKCILYQKVFRQREMEQLRNSPDGLLSAKMYGLISDLGSPDLTKEIFVVKSKSGYWVRSSPPYSDTKDADICKLPVSKIEHALGRCFVCGEFLGRPTQMYRLTTPNDVFYFDGVNNLSTDMDDLKLRPIEGSFHEFDVQLAN